MGGESGSYVIHELFVTDDFNKEFLTTSQSDTENGCEDAYAILWTGSRVGRKVVVERNTRTRLTQTKCSVVDLLPLLVGTGRLESPNKPLFYLILYTTTKRFLFYEVRVFSNNGV